MAQGDLITNPGKIIESIYRDDIFSETKLKVLVVNSETSITVNCESKEIDYYKNASIFFPGEEHKITASSPEVTGNTLSLATPTTALFNAPCFISNIQAVNRLDLNSFVSVGGLGGSRADWIFKGSIYQVQDTSALLNSLLFDSHCALFRYEKKYRLIDLDPLTVPDGTFFNPLKEDSKPLISINPSDLDEVYNSFRLKFGYDHLTGQYRYELYCDALTNSEGFDTDLMGYRDLCKAAKTNYKISRPWIYESVWIYDFDTALKLLKRKIVTHTKVRLKVNWAGAAYDHLQFQQGDKVLIDFPRYMADTVNNSTQFIISGIQYNINPGTPEVHFKLLELVDII